jgi:hypothetical protein
MAYPFRDEVHLDSVRYAICHINKRRARGNSDGTAMAARRGHLGPRRVFDLCYFVTPTSAVDVSCFCCPSWMKFAISVRGTESP